MEFLWIWMNLMISIMKYKMSSRKGIMIPSCFASSCISILPRGTPHNGFEGFRKIAWTGKTATVTDINNTLFSGIQHVTGFFNPIVDQILDRRLSNDIAERTLYFPFADICGLCQLLQRNGFGIIILNIPDHFFDMLHFLRTFVLTVRSKFCSVLRQQQKNAGIIFRG